MLDRKHLSFPRRRVRLAATISLILIITGGVSLTAWSAGARLQETLAARAAPQEATETAPTPAIKPENTPVQLPAVTPAAVAAQRPGRQPAFTVTWTRTATFPDSQARLLQTTKRYQRSDGVYKLVHTFHGQDNSADRVETYFGFMGLGVFRLDEERRQFVFIAPMTEEQPEDLEAYLRADSRFNREDAVQGQHAIVWHTPTYRDTGYIEEYRAPSLGGLLIKRVEESPQLRSALAR